MLTKGFMLILGGAGLVTLFRFRNGSERRLDREVQKAEGARQKFAEQAAEQAARLARIESLVNRHEARLREVRPNTEMMAVMEEMVGDAMARIDQRFSSYNESLEELRSAVGRTEELMEAVLANFRCVVGERSNGAQMAGRI